MAVRNTTRTITKRPTARKSTAVKQTVQPIVKTTKKVAARKKTATKKKTTQKRIANTAAKKVAKLVTPKPAEPIIKPVPAPLSIPAVKSVAPVSTYAQPVPTASYRELHAAPPKRFKLWLTVGLSMAVIVCLWAYSLSQNLLSSTSLQDSSKEMELGDLVDDLGGSLANLKDQTDTLTQQAEQQNINSTNTNTAQPSNQQLDNLFSDIQ